MDPKRTSKNAILIKWFDFVEWAWPGGDNAVPGCVYAVRILHVAGKERRKDEPTVSLHGNHLWNDAITCQTTETEIISDKRLFKVLFDLK